MIPRPYRVVCELPGHRERARTFSTEKRAVKSARKRFEKDGCRTRVLHGKTLVWDALGRHISGGAYHADPAETPSLSSSIAHTLCTGSPAHAWTQHPRLNPEFERIEDGKFDVGTAAHALLLQGEQIAEVIDADDWRTNAAKDQRDEARAAGRVPLLAHQWQEVQAMVQAARRQLDALKITPPLFRDGKPEQAIVWREPAAGISCRALIDWLHDDFSAIDDYKTTGGSADPEPWTTRTLFQIGADIQVAFYLRGIKALTGEEPEWRYVVQETFPPYALSVISLGPDVLAVADAKVQYAIAKWAACLEADFWPGYPTQVCFAQLPGWIEEQWMTREAREAV